MKVSDLKELQWVKLGEEHYQVGHVNPFYARLHPKGINHSISIIVTDDRTEHALMMKELRPL